MENKLGEHLLENVCRKVFEMDGQTNKHDTTSKVQVLIKQCSHIWPRLKVSLIRVGKLWGRPVKCKSMEFLNRLFSRNVHKVNTTYVFV